MVLFGLSSPIGVSLMNSSAPKIPHYYPHFRPKNFVGKKNAQIQGKSAVHPVGLTSILTQYMGIFLRQNRVRMCALWLSNGRTNPARLKNVKFPVFIVSPLEIRRYIGVTKLQKRIIFLFLRSKSFCRSFLCAGKREIGHQADAYG